MNPTPFQRAARLCALRGGNFHDELAAYHTGYIVSLPHLFVMARDCPKGADVSDPWRSWTREESDAVFVWSAVGDIRALVALLPWRPAWIGFHRQNRGWTENRWMSITRLESALALKVHCAGATARMERLRISRSRNAP